MGTAIPLPTRHPCLRRHDDLQQAARHTIVDYLGTHQHLAVDLECRVDNEGAMCIRSGEQRFYEGPVAVRFR